jgi:hypothetical protein
LAAETIFEENGGVAYRAFSRVASRQNKIDRFELQLRIFLFGRFFQDSAAVRANSCGGGYLLITFGAVGEEFGAANRTDLVIFIEESAAVGAV